MFDEVYWLIRLLGYLVGVGGAVLRDKTNELLVIKERIRNIEFWKVKQIW